MVMSDAEMKRAYEKETVTFEAESAPEVVEVVEIEGRQIAIVRYATLNMPARDSAPVFGFDDGYAAMLVGDPVHSLRQTFYVNTSEYHQAGDSSGGLHVACTAGREYARCATVKATIKAARERIERSRLHDQYGPVAVANIGTHTRDAFEALDADAEIARGDLVVVYSQARP